MEENKSRKWLFDKMVQLGYDVGGEPDDPKTYEGFSKAINENEDTRQDIYKQMTAEGYTLRPTYEEFAKAVMDAPVQTSVAAEPVESIRVEDVKYPLNAQEEGPYKPKLNTGMQFQPEEAPSQYTPLPQQLADEDAQRAAVQASGDVLSPEEAEVMKAQLAAGQAKTQQALAPLQTPTIERTGHEQDFNAIANSIWDAAEERTKAAQEEEAQKVSEAYSNIPQGTGSGYASAMENAIRQRAAYLSNHDLEQMSEEAWNSIGADGQKEIIGDIYAKLKEQYPYHDDKQLFDVAKATARSRSDQSLYDLAIEKNAPANVAEYFLRKVVAANMLSKIADATARSQAGTSGDMLARDMAEQQFGKDHKVADIAGTVVGMGLDPLTWIAGGIGGAASKLGRAAIGLKNADTLGGRILLGSLASSGNLGAYMSGSEALDQLRLGGKVGEDGKIGDYDFGAIAGAGGRGAALGLGTGIIAPLIGNVSDKLVNATRSTAGKAALRAGEIGAGTLAEATVFSLPEWIKGEGDAWDIWTDNLAMMAGFRLQRALKSAPARIAEWEKTGETKAGFETRLRKMLDGEPSLALTAEERAELKDGGYGDLNELILDYTQGNKTEALAMPGGKSPLPYGRFADLMNDGNISEAARAKMYYYATGRRLPMSTVMEAKVIPGADGKYTVQSIGANGVITSRNFNSARRAETEVAKINRQAELNKVDVGEQFASASNYNPDAIRAELKDKYGVDVDEAIAKEQGRRSDGERLAVDEYIKRLFDGIETEEGVFAPEAAEIPATAQPTETPIVEEPAQVPPADGGTPPPPAAPAPVREPAPAPEPVSTQAPEPVSVPEAAQEVPQITPEAAKADFVKIFGGDVTQKGGTNVVPIYHGNELFGYEYARVPAGYDVEETIDGVSHVVPAYNYIILEPKDGRLITKTVPESEFNKKDANGRIYRKGTFIPEANFYSDYAASKKKAEQQMDDYSSVITEENKRQIEQQKAELYANATPAERNEMVKQMNEEEFLATLPKYESGAKKGQLNYSAFSPAQEFRFVSMQLGIDTAVARAQKKIADGEAKVAKVDPTTAPLEDVMAAKDLQAVVDEYKNILAQYNQEVPPAEVPVEEPAPVQAEAPVAEEPVQTPAPAAAPAEPAPVVEPAPVEKAPEAEKPKRRKPKKTGSTVAALAKAGGAKQARENAAASVKNPVENLDGVLADFESKDPARIKEAKQNIMRFTEMMDAPTASEEYARVKAERREAEAGTPLALSLKNRLSALERHLKALGVDPSKIKPLEKETTPTTIPTPPTTSSTTQEDKASVKEQRPEAKEKSKQEPARTAAPVSETSSAEAPAPAPAVGKVQTFEEASKELATPLAKKFIDAIIKSIQEKVKGEEAVRTLLKKGEEFHGVAPKKEILDATIKLQKGIEEKKIKANADIDKALTNIEYFVRQFLKNEANVGRTKPQIDAMDMRVDKLVADITKALEKYNDKKHDGHLRSDEEYADVSRMNYAIRDLTNEYKDDPTMTESAKSLFDTKLRDAMASTVTLLGNYRTATGKKHSEILANTEMSKRIDKNAAKPAKGTKGLWKLRQVDETKKAKAREEAKRVAKIWDEPAMEAAHLYDEIHGKDGAIARIKAINQSISELQKYGAEASKGGVKVSPKEAANAIAKYRDNLKAEQDRAKSLEEQIKKMKLQDVWNDYILQGGIATQARKSLADRLGVNTATKKSIENEGEPVGEEALNRIVNRLSPSISQAEMPVKVVRHGEFEKAVANEDGQEVSIDDALGKIGVKSRKGTDTRKTVAFIGKDGVIYVDSDTARAGTPLHEIGIHAFARIARENRYDDFLKAILRYGKLADEEFKQYVRDNYDYKEGSDEFYEEVAAHAFGRRMEEPERKYADQNAFQRFIDAIRRFLRKLGEKLGLRDKFAPLGVFSTAESMGFKEIEDALYKIATDGRPIRSRKIGMTDEIKRAIIGKKYAEANDMTENLLIAEDMLERGVDAETISDATGWYYSDKGGGWMYRVPTIEFKKSGGIPVKTLTEDGYQQLKAKLQQRANDVYKKSMADGNGGFLTRFAISSDSKINPFVKRNVLKHTGTGTISMPDSYAELQYYLIKNSPYAPYGLGERSVDEFLKDVEDTFPEVISNEQIGDGNFYESLFEKDANAGQNITIESLLGKEFSVDDVFEPSEELERLKNAYPRFSDARIRFEKLNGMAGAYHPETNTISINPYAEPSSNESYRTEESALSTGVHEVQHLIQEEEGFARGGNTDIDIIKNDARVVAARESLDTANKDLNNKIADIVWKDPEYIKLEDELARLTDEIKVVDGEIDKILDANGALGKLPDELINKFDELTNRINTINNQLNNLIENVRSSDALVDDRQRVKDAEQRLDTEKSNAYMALFGENQSRAASRGITADKEKTALDLMKEQAVSDAIGTEDMTLDEMPFIYNLDSDGSNAESRETKPVELTPEQQNESRALNHQYGELLGLIDGVSGRYIPSDWYQYLKAAGYEDPVLYNMLNRKNPMSLMTADQIIDWANKRYKSYNPANEDVSGSAKPKYYHGKLFPKSLRGEPINVKFNNKTYNIAQMGDALDYLFTVMKDQIHNYHVLRDKIDKAGGQIPEDGMDILFTNRTERANTANKNYGDEYFKPLSDATVAIIKHLKHGSDKKTSQIFKEIGYYLLALHAPARNKWLTIKHALKTVEKEEGVPQERDVEAMYNNICLGNMTANDYAGANKATQKLAKYFEERKAPELRNESGSNDEISLDDRGAAWIVEQMEDKVPAELLANLRSASRAASQRILELGKEYGFNNQEFIDWCNEHYPDYVPYQDWENDEDREKFWLDFDSAQGRNKDGYPRRFDPSIKEEAEGRTTIPENPIPMIRYKAANTIFLGEENKSRQKLYELADMNRGLSNLIYSDYVDANGDVVPAGKMPEWLEKLGDNAKNYSVMTYINGKKVPVYINGNDGRLLHRGLEDPISAIKKLRRDSAVIDWLYNNNTKLLGLMSQIHTTYNPVFPPKNMVRDVKRAAGQMFITRSTKEFGEYLKRIGPSFIESFNNKRGNPSQMFKEFLEDGGYIGYSHLGDPQRYAREGLRAIDRITRTGKEKNAAVRFADWWRDVAEMFENVARYDVYVTARNNGASRPMAAFLAHEMSTNLSRRGTQQGWSAHTMFFNAALESAAQEARNVQKHPGRTAAWKSMMVAMGLLKAILGAAISRRLIAGNKDDREAFEKAMNGIYDEYTKRENVPGIFDRENPYYWVPDDKKRGSFLLPLNVTDDEQVEGILFPNAFGYRWDQYLGDLTAQLIAGKVSGGEYLKKALDALIDEYSPFAGSAISADNRGGKKNWQRALNLVPSTLRPIAESAFNISSLGNDIYDEPKDGTAAKTRNTRQNARPGTNPIIKEIPLGKIHPEQLEYVLRNMMGTYYDLFDYATSSMMLPEAERAKYGPKTDPFARAIYLRGTSPLTDRLQEMRKYANLEKSYLERAKDPLGEGKKGLDPQHINELLEGNLSGASELQKRYDAEKKKLKADYDEALKVARNRGFSKKERKDADEAAMAAYADGLLKLNYEYWKTWESIRKDVIEGLKTVK